MFKKIILGSISAISFISASVLLYYSNFDTTINKVTTKQEIQSLISKQLPIKRERKIHIDVLSKRFKDKEIQLELKDKVINFKNNRIIMTSIIEVTHQNKSKEIFVLDSTVWFGHSFNTQELYISESSVINSKDINPKRIKLTHKDYTTEYKKRLEKSNQKSGITNEINKAAAGILNAAFGFNGKKKTIKEIEDKYIKSMRSAISYFSATKIKIADESVFIPFSIFRENMLQKNNIEILSDNEIQFTIKYYWRNDMSKLKVWLYTGLLYIIFIITLIKFRKIKKEV